MLNVSKKCRTARCPSFFAAGSTTSSNYALFFDNHLVIGVRQIVVLELYLGNLYLPIGPLPPVLSLPYPHRTVPHIYVHQP
jgi:hypothetical protein